MSIWKLSKEAKEDSEKLYKFMRQRPLLAGTKKACTLIDRLSATNEPAAIPSVASGLFSRDKAIHTAASSGIAKLLELVPSMDLIRLNELLGGYSYGYVSDRWDKIKPKLVESYLSEKDDVGVGNLLSFHKNGYVRQVAVRFLSTVESGEELRFLLVRQNDWVDNIAEHAQSIVRDRLTDGYLKHFVSETDLLFHLLQCKRRDLSKTISKYVDLLVEPQHRQYLQHAASSVEKKTGRKFVEHLLCRPGDHLAATIRSGVTSDDPVIRYRILCRARRNLPHAECVEIADRMLSDKFISVRQEAYELKAKLSPAASNDVWKQCLFDKSKSLRETAMFYLGKSGFDVASIYREYLSRFPNSLPGLSGLAISGNRTDVELFSRYLASPFASRRAEAVRGIGRVGNELEVLGLQQSFLDESPRVVKATFQQLQPIGKAIDSAFLFGLIEHCQSFTGKKVILRLLLDLGRWSAMSYLIRAAASPDQSLADYSKFLIDYAFSLNRDFTQPSLEQKEHIQAAIDESKESLGVEVWHELSSYLASFGFVFAT